jgi:phospholipid/cholesterol/gamma-HCH transport system substrate-binding protein
VTLNGLVIGKVSSITIDEKTGILLVQLQLKQIFLYLDQAAIYEPGFIGKQIAIIPNFEDKTLAVDGQMLQGGVKWVLRIK